MNTSASIANKDLYEVLQDIKIISKNNTEALKGVEKALDRLDINVTHAMERSEETFRNVMEKSERNFNSATDRFEKTIERSDQRFEKAMATFTSELNIINNTYFFISFIIFLINFCNFISQPKSATYLMERDIDKKLQHLLMNKNKTFPLGAIVMIDKIEKSYDFFRKIFKGVEGKMEDFHLIRDGLN